jgi:hypothetical protein
MAKKMTDTKAGSKASKSAETAIDWRTEMLERVRAIIMQAGPGIVEEIKWRKPSNGMQGVPVWSCGGMICTGETYKNAVKLTFAKGASLEDPAKLFNASLDGGTRRAIDLHEGDVLNEKALAGLVRAATALNADKPAKKSPAKARSAVTSVKKKPASAARNKATRATKR